MSRNGNYRMCSTKEIKPIKAHETTARVWVYDDFLSKEECEHLMNVHEQTLSSLYKKPIICFENIEAFRQQLLNLKQKKLSQSVTTSDFIKNTLCVNETMSSQLKQWGLTWSFTTSTYRSEERLSTIFGTRIKLATNLDAANGGKYSTISYPYGVKTGVYEDCTQKVKSKDRNEKYATVFFFLNDLGGRDGGDLEFPDLGISVKPRQGRAVVWNNMNYKSLDCEFKTKYVLKKMRDPSPIKLYAMKIWYFYENFNTLLTRQDEALLPKRARKTPKVECTEQACNWMDQWKPENTFGKTNQLRNF